MSLGSKSPDAFSVGNVQFIGSSDKLDFKQTDDALEIDCPARFPSEYVALFKMTPK